MKGVYENNPALGDPMSVEGQLNECNHKLQKLKAELARYNAWLEAAMASDNGGPAQFTPAKLNGGHHRYI